MDEFRPENPDSQSSSLNRLPGAQPAGPQPPYPGGGQPAQPQYQPPTYLPPGYVPPYARQPLAPAQRRAGMPTWATVCLILTLIGLLMVGGCIWFVYAVVQQTKQSSTPQPAKVHTGTALAWRDIAPPDSGLGSEYHQSYGGNVLIGNFDSDPDDELLVGDYSSMRLYELDEGGKSRPVQGQLSNTDAAWDANGDGVMELVSKDSADNKLKAYDLAGKVVKEIGAYDIPYSGPSEVTHTADVDGDGKPELLVQDSSGHLVALNRQGKAVWQVGSFNQGPGGTFGDVDGDGKAELISMSNAGPGEVEATGLGQSAQTFKGGPLVAMPSGCADLNGDKRDEILFGAAGYLNPATGKFTGFSAPMMMRMMGGMSGSVPCDIDGDGKLDLAINEASMGNGSDLRVFSQDGKLKYHESFGEAHYGVYGAQAGGKQRLIVVLPEKLLVWP